MSWKPDVCIYHFPCDDGFASAWIAQDRWPSIILVPANYGQPIPGVDIAGKNLLIVDFSYKPDVLTELAGKAKSIVILDHHKTAQADLQSWAGGNAAVVPKLDNIELAAAQACTETGFPIVATFDMDRSGASLTWEFCYPDRPMPLMVQFIEDRDLWRFKLKETRAFSLYLRSFPYDMATWTAISNAIVGDANRVIGEALSIERFYNQKLADIVLTATLKTIGKWNGVPVAHAPYAFASDLAHELLKAHKDAPFAAVVVDAYGGRTYSLRSEDSRQDVSEVAKMFGGGGHRNAAGFRVPT